MMARNTGRRSRIATESPDALQFISAKTRGGAFGSRQDTLLRQAERCVRSYLRRIGKAMNR